MFEHPCFFYGSAFGDQTELVYAIRHGGRAVDDDSWPELLAALPGIPGTIHPAPADIWTAFGDAADEPGRIEVAVWDEWAVVYQNLVDPMDPSDESPPLFVAEFRKAAERLGWKEIIAAFGQAFGFEFDEWTADSMAIRPPSRIPAALGVGQSPLAPSQVFGSTDLVQAIEGANAEFLRRSVEAAAVADSFVTPVAGGVAAYAGPDSPFNKVAGLGFEGAVLAEELDRIEAAYFERGSAVSIELPTLAHHAIAPMLSERGYALVGFEDVRVRRSDYERRTVEGVEVLEGRADDLDAWVHAMVDGFANPDTQGVSSHEHFPREAMARAIRQQLACDDTRRYVARRADIVAGGASMATVFGVAFMCGAATLPAHRRKGVQQALLAHRIAEAWKGGCELMAATVLPGSKSAENMSRAGFELVYTRAILLRPPA